MRGMVVQQTLDNLKDKPHDEKKVVASGIAIGVVVILLIGWGFLFLRKIQRGTVPTFQGSAVPQDQIDASFIQQTQQQINQYYQSSQDQLKNIRDSSAQTQVQGSTDNTQAVPASGGSDQFGSQ